MDNGFDNDPDMQLALMQQYLKSDKDTALRPTDQVTLMEALQDSDQEQVQIQPPTPEDSDFQKFVSLKLNWPIVLIFVCFQSHSIESTTI